MFSMWLPWTKNVLLPPYECKKNKKKEQNKNHCSLPKANVADT